MKRRLRRIDQVRRFAPVSREQLRQTVRPDRADVPADQNAALREAAQHQTVFRNSFRSALANFSMLNICRPLVDVHLRCRVSPWHGPRRPHAGWERRQRKNSQRLCGRNSQRFAGKTARLRVESFWQPETLHSQFLSKTRLMVPRHDIRAALVDASLVRMLYEPFTQSSVHRVPLARAHHVSYVPLVCYTSRSRRRTLSV